MKTIPLTKGYFAKVDDDDYERLAKIRWQVDVRKTMIIVKHGYSKDGRSHSLYMAREIMNAPKGKQVDHINGDTLDNRKSNLRICTNSENSKNRGKHSDNTSGYKGVKFDTRMGFGWIAQICVNYKRIYIGKYKTKEAAARAYNKAAKKHHGEYAVLNVLPKGKTT